MKILHTLATLDPASGGPARSVPQLALALAERGHEVGIWSSGAGGGRQEAAGLATGKSLADLNPSAAKKIQLLGGDFEEALEDFGLPEIVHDHGIWLPCHREVARVCRERAVPRIVSPRGMLEPWALNHKKWKKRLAWWLYQRRDLQGARGLHATAGAEADQLRRLGLRAPIVVAANGVAVPEPGEGRSREQRKQREQEEPCKTVLFLSRIHPKKGLPLLVKAWAALRPEGWRMRVVGPDEQGHRRDLEAKVRAAGLAGEWHFEEPLEGEAKFQAMRDADLFVLPSHSENFGIVVAEALACATPVITTTGTPWSGLLDHRCGWWVAPEVTALMEALQEATTLREAERAAMGERGRAWVGEEFAWPGIARTMEKFYRDLLSQEGEASTL